MHPAEFLRRSACSNQKATPSAERAAARWKLNTAVFKSLDEARLLVYRPRVMPVAQLSATTARQLRVESAIGISNVVGAGGHGSFVCRTQTAAIVAMLPPNLRRRS